MQTAERPEVRNGHYGRPLPQSRRYVGRPRLLALLPRAEGHAAWLRAPYGYGKTVLLAQWAEGMRELGWRPVWVNARLTPVREGLAEQLGLARDAPWGAVAEALASCPTAVVVDEADHADEPVPLADFPAPVGLASRHDLPWPDLARLAAAGRVAVLSARELAFTLDEARLVFGRADGVEQTWQSTGGWPLGLALMATTGHDSVRAAVLAGIRDSLGREEWRAAALLASVPELPETAAPGAAERLVRAGFAERTERGYRTHDLIARTIREVAPEEVRSAVAEHADRLPVAVRAEAYLGAGMERELVSLLAGEEGQQLAYREPWRLVRVCDELSQRLSGELPPAAQLNAGLALCHAGRLDAGLAVLRRLGRLAPASPEVSVFALAYFAYYGAGVDLDGAVEAAERVRTLAGSLPREQAARALNRVLWAYLVAGRAQEALECVRAVEGLLSPDDPFRVYPLRLNRAVVEFELHGHLEELAAQYAAAAVHPEVVGTYNEPLSWYDLGRTLLLLGRREEALAALERAAAGRSLNFWAGALADGWLACLRKDCSAFPRLLSLAETGQDPEVADTLRSLWARTLREQGRLLTAQEVLGKAEGPWTTLERVSVLAGLGRLEEARAQLPSRPVMREQALHWLATRYRVEREEAVLDELVASTDAGARLLPSLLELRELPEHRPDLARWYPVEAVLRSGWLAALRGREEEVPPLRVRLLGEFRVERLGEPVRLSRTLRSLLLLLVLGFDRDRICEALWPEADSEASANRLHVQLHYLRRALEPWGTRCYLGPDGLQRVEADLWHVEEALRREDAAAVYVLYREPVAPGVDLPVVDEWRRALHRRVTALLLRAGREQAQLRWLERAVELDPLNEEAVQNLLRVLVQSGRRADARRVYRAFARRLRRELDSEPGAETRAILKHPGAANLPGTVQEKGVAAWSLAPASQNRLRAHRDRERPRS